MFDDVALMRLFKRNGHSVGFHAAPGLLQVRLFKGNRDAFWGTTKNILAGMGTPWLAPVVMFLPVFVFWTPLLAAAVGIGAGNERLLVAGAATYAIQYGVLWTGRGVVRFHPAKALFFPLVAVLVICCTVRALYLLTVKGAIHWRGRTIRIR
jgi:hypothetical protein